MIYKEIQFLKSTLFFPGFYRVLLLIFFTILLKERVELTKSSGYSGNGVSVTFVLLLGQWILKKKPEISMDFTGRSFKSPSFFNSWEKFKSER